jgi:hypothetical protein
MDVTLEDAQRDDALVAEIGIALGAYGQRSPAHSIP